MLCRIARLAHFGDKGLQVSSCCEGGKLGIGNIISRSLSTTAVCHTSDENVSRSTELKAAEETQNVNAMDRLLKLARRRANPAHQNVIQMTKIPWKDALRLHRANTLPVDLTTPAKRAPYNLTPRNMHDSYSEIMLPFASSPELLDQYTNVTGGIRTSMLMEHLDSLAASISYKHMLGPTGDVAKARDFYMVTASVDRLDMLAPLSPVRDLRLSGQVIHAGRSSLETAVCMEAIDEDGSQQTVLLGRFFMVCRDARTHAAHPVNPLILSTVEDKMLFQIGEAHKQSRQATAVRSLTKVPPSSSEAEALHALFLQYGQEDDSGVSPAGERVWMGDTQLEKTLTMFPQERNVHQKIFGGYLMRLAYELGFTNATLFTRRPVHFLSLDGISFAKPVPIGSILQLTSHIIHTTSSPQYSALVHVLVTANVVDVATGKSQMTNDFRFTWYCNADESPLSRHVVPKTYKEAMLWVEGKRALDMGAEIRGKRKSQ